MDRGFDVRCPFADRIRSESAASLPGTVSVRSGSASCPRRCFRATLGANPDAIRLLAIKPDLQVGITVGSGHFHQLEVPDQVNAMIERFLAIAV